MYTEYFALIISYSSHETKTTKLQPKIEHIYRIFLPWSSVKMINYKTTSWNRTCILNIFALVIWWSEKLQNYNPKSNIHTGYFGHGHKLFFSRNKNYKAATQNRTHILNILAPVRGWNEKLQSYKLKLNIHTGYFGQSHKLFFSRNKNYKTKTQNRTYKPNIFALVRC